MLLGLWGEPQKFTLLPDLKPLSASFVPLKLSNNELSSTYTVGLQYENDLRHGSLNMCLLVQHWMLTKWKLVIVITQFTEFVQLTKCDLGQIT